MKTIFRSLICYCLILMSSLANAATTAPTPCGTTLLDVVIMLDRTGSVSNAERASEAAAAKALLDTMASLNNGHRVAIGAFNATPRPATASAEIEATLSTNYANLKTVVDSALAASSASTNIEAALKVSYDELVAHGNAGTKKVIVLVSDGQTNVRLTNQTCDAGLGYTAEECSAYKQAETIKAAGVTVITVAYDVMEEDSTTVKGRALLAAIATQPSADNSVGSVDAAEQYAENNDGDNFYISPTSELTAVFNRIGGTILCNDGDACTIDLCSTANQCVFTPVDTDNDGNGDCTDGCPLDPIKNSPGQCGCGAPDTDTDADGTANCLDQCPSDVTKTAPGQCGCGIADTDTDGDGQANCNDQCPSDPTKTIPGQCGCGIADTDSDGDGIPNCSDACPAGTNADTDSDGTPDCNDQCPTDAAKTQPGQCGCGTADNDGDEDGSADCNDNCPTDPTKTAPGTCGCNVAEVDSDRDGTLNCVDACPDDTGKVNPGICGCGTPDVDTDGDGTPDCNDECNDSPTPAPALVKGVEIRFTKTVPGQCGCGVPDTDTDGDGVADCNDSCPTDPGKTEEGACGCNVSDADTDGDDVADCNDSCPGDEAKTELGRCGCGVADADTDEDDVPACLDECPTDSNKTDPGQCGCGTEDVDSDEDGTANCNDQCPADGSKTEPGVCGCGFTDADSDEDGVADCIEVNEDTTPLCTDLDSDGICDENDNCPLSANHDQLDSDADSEGDVCDASPLVVPVPAGTGVAGGRNCALSPDAGFNDGLSILLGLVMLSGLLMLKSGRDLKKKQVFSFFFAVLLTMAWSSPSWALNVQKWRPSTGQTSGNVVQTSETLPKYHFAAGLNVNLANHPFEVVTVPGTGRVAGIVDRFITADALLEYGAADWLTLKLDVPVNIYHDIAPTFIPTRDRSGGDMGDIQVSAKVRAFDADKTATGLGLAFVPFITLPTGEAGIFFGEDNVTGGLIVSGDWKFLEKNRIAVNAGAKFRETETVGNLTVKNEFLYGLGYQHDFCEKFAVIGEAFGSTNISGKFAREDISSPLEGAVTLRKKWGKTNRLVTDLTGGMGITNGYGLPNYRVATGISYMWGGKQKEVAEAPRSFELASEVLFDFAKYNIKPAAFPVLNDFAAETVKHPKTIVTIEGHTDAIGSDASNMKLSQNRANSIKGYLVNKGVGADRLTAVGYGESKPVATNDTAEGRQKNRRAVFVVKSRRD